MLNTIRAGRDDHRDQIRVAIPGERLALASTSRALAVPQGWRRTVIGPFAADLTERLGRCAELVLRIEEEDGDLRVGVEPVQLELAVVTSPWNRPRTSSAMAQSGLEEDPADHPGLLDRLAVRADDPGLHVAPRRRTTLTSRLSRSRLQVAGDEGVGVDSDGPPGLPAGHPFRRSPGAHNRRWGPGQRASRFGQDHELIRAIRARPRGAIPGELVGPRPAASAILECRLRPRAGPSPPRLPCRG